MNVKEKIEEVLNNKIKPVVQGHGGDVKLKSFENGVATVSLSGACVGCPSADLSTREMIEAALKEEIAEVEAVSIDVSIPEDMLEFARKIFRGEL